MFVFQHQDIYFKTFDGFVKNSKFKLLFSHHSKAQLKSILLPLKHFFLCMPPRCVVTPRKINTLLNQHENGTHTPHNWDLCDSRKLVNFLFMITKSLLRDLLTFDDIPSFFVTSTVDISMFWFTTPTDDIRTSASFHEAFIIAVIWF